MEIVGFGIAIIIGLTLGLMGGGGSILTVPALVYVLSYDAKTATAYSLFIVGVSSLVGAIQFMKQKLIDFKTVAIFAAPAMVAVFLTRAFIVPLIPYQLFSIRSYAISGDMGILVLFALIMIGSAISMIRGKNETNEDLQQIKYNYPMIFIEGIVVGLITGIVGAGGGFLIIPALVLLARLPMKLAIGTSLMIIAIKSIIGFMGDVFNPEIGNGAGIDWKFLAMFSGFAIVGILIGAAFNKKVSSMKLKKAFGWFVLIAGTFMLTERIISII